MNYQDYKIKKEQIESEFAIKMLSLRNQQNEKPEKLYMYRDINMFTEEMICHNNIFLSSPKNFNDPFDTNIGLVEIEKGVNIEETIKSNEEVANKLSKVGIACFSSKNDDILMWSHYANKHSGICIEFTPDYNAYPFSEIKEVKYVNDKTKDDANTLDVKNIAIRKYITWQYEDEYRIISEKDCNTTIEIDSSKISGVIYGSMISKANRELVHKWIKRSNNKNIKEYRVIKKWDEYHLIIYPEIDFEVKKNKIFLSAFSLASQMKKNK